jgi:hypothetical protein
VNVLARRNRRGGETDDLAGSAPARPAIGDRDLVARRNPFGRDGAVGHHDAGRQARAAIRTPSSGCRR